MFLLFYFILAIIQFPICLFIYLFLFLIISFYFIGSPVECIYALQSFGISSKQIPLDTSTGELNLTNHNRWLKLCAAKEENLKLYKRIIECPNHSDILFGRGQIVMNHPGNALLRNVIQSKLDEYSRISLSKSKSKQASTQLTWDVVRILKSEYGARFLKEESVETNGLCWVEVSNETARSKVRIAFRDARTRLAKSSSTAKGSSSSTNTTSDTTSCSRNSSSGTIYTAKTKRKSKTKSKTIPDTDAGLSSLSSSLSSPSSSSSLSSMAPQCNLLQRQSQQLPIQVADSSTSAFLGMDGGDSKRQKLCSHNYFDWDCA